MTSFAFLYGSSKRPCIIIFFLLIFSWSRNNVLFSRDLDITKVVFSWSRLNFLVISSHNCDNRWQYRTTDGEFYTVYPHRPTVRVWDRGASSWSYNLCNSLLTFNWLMHFKCLNKYDNFAWNCICYLTLLLLHDRPESRLRTQCGFLIFLW